MKEFGPLETSLNSELWTSKWKLIFSKNKVGVTRRIYGDKKIKRWSNSHIPRPTLKKLKYKIELVPCLSHISKSFEFHVDFTALLLPNFFTFRSFLLSTSFISHTYFLDLCVCYSVVRLSGQENNKKCFMCPGSKPGCVTNECKRSSITAIVRVLFISLRELIDLIRLTNSSHEKFHLSQFPSARTFSILLCNKKKNIL